MTEGDPVESVKKGLADIILGIEDILEVKGVGVTGSGRYFVGDFVGADVVINEITAQAKATFEIDNTVDTIFEIGGQDSKYISLKNGSVVDFEMNKDGDNFNPPSFEGFKVVGGPNQAISNSYINGKRRYSKTYSYFLSPKSQGKFSIKQATIEIGDKIYKTLPIHVVITAAVTKPGSNIMAEPAMIQPLQYNRPAMADI